MSLPASYALALCLSYHHKTHNTYIVFRIIAPHTSQLCTILYVTFVPCSKPYPPESDNLHAADPGPCRLRLCPTRADGAFGGKDTRRYPDSKVRGANMGPTGPWWAPCWPNESCYLCTPAKWMIAVDTEQWIAQWFHSCASTICDLVLTGHFTLAAITVTTVLVIYHCNPFEYRTIV